MNKEERGIVKTLARNKRAKGALLATLIFNYIKGYESAKSHADKYLEPKQIKGNDKSC